MCVSSGSRSQAGPYSIAVPQRLLAVEPDRIPQSGMDRSARDVPRRGASLEAASIKLCEIR